MIPLSTFLSAVDRNAARVTEYQNGGDGTGGKCDCIGLIIGAVRLCGEKWPWMHGSNYTARYLLAGGIQKGAPLKLGDLVFKARAPGESGYALPDKYKQGGSYYNGDLNDYYHVGVVTCDSPLCITHCTTVAGGIKHDSTRGKWLYSGELKLVNYEGGETPMQTAIVAAPSGKTVNLRSGSGTTYTILTTVPVGAEVTVIDYNAAPDWARVTYGKYTGWMMRRYLVMQGGESDTQDSADGEALTVDRATLEALRSALKAAYEAADKMLGVWK